MQSEKDEHKVIDLQRAGCLLVEDGNHGEYRPRPNEFGSGNTAFIRAADMEGGRILFESAGKISDTALARITKGIGRGGDILFSHKGTVGKLALAPLDAPPFVCSPQTTFWRTLDEERIDRLYLYYFMCSRRFWEQWHSRKGETDMADYVSLTAQRELFVVVPHIDVQRAIGRILGALDDNIELNRQMNRTLEAMAQAIFKSWFVDFDPVTAKAVGRKPYGMSEESIALFPDAFEDSTLGAIPKGWNVRQVKDLGSVVCGKTPSTREPDNFGSEIPFITIPDMHGVIFVTQTERGLSVKGADSQVKKYLPENSICVSCIATPGLVSITSKLSQTNQQINSVIPHTAISPYFCYWLLRNLGDEIRAGGSGGTVFHNLNTGNFSKIEIIVPADPLIDAFHSSCEGMMKMILENQRQAQTLSDLRDLLLPKLLSGEIRVRQAENLVAEAV